VACLVSHSGKWHYNGCRARLQRGRSGSDCSAIKLNHAQPRFAPSHCGWEGAVGIRLGLSGLVCLQSRLGALCLMQLSGHAVTAHPSPHAVSCSPTQGQTWALTLASGPGQVARRASGLLSVTHTHCDCTAPYANAVTVQMARERWLDFRLGYRASHFSECIRY
jgi:hypothetical protein